MNLKLIWINILNPILIKNEIKRKSTNYYIFLYKLWFNLFIRFIIVL